LKEVGLQLKNASTYYANSNCRSLNLELQNRSLNFQVQLLDF